MSADGEVRRREPKPRPETVRHYLETIYYIAGEGEVVRPGRVAEWLGVSAPTVSVTVRRLERDGWISIAEDRSITMTPKGERLAAEVVRHHRLLERWLTDALGLDWASADEEAQRLAPGLSEVVAERLDRVLGRPKTCPHGNVIPGRPAPYGRLTALSSLPPGRPAVVRRISEVAEHDAPHVLRELERHGIVPGRELRVDEGGTALGAVSVLVAGLGHTSLGPEVARAVWVEPAIDENPTL